ncbi:MAG: hypothetical protein AB1756_04985 [Acidobacteriota bacterium]
MRKRLPLAIVILISLAFFSWLIMMLIAPEEDTVTTQGITIQHDHDEDERQLVDHLLVARVLGDVRIRRVTLFYRIGGEKDLHQIEMKPVLQSNHYSAFIPGQGIGSKIYYYFVAESEKGEKATLPAEAAEGKGLYGGMYRIGFEGKVTKPLLWMHILFMVSALIFLIHSIYFALRNCLTGEDFMKCYGTVLAGTIIFTVTAFGIGPYVAWEAFGVGWSGIPYGWDITDNKSLVIALYFWIILILGRKNFRQKEEKFLRNRTFAALSIIGIILTAVLYLVPHSI